MYSEYIEEQNRSEDYYVWRLRNEYGYPDEDIRREFSCALGKARYRLDIVVVKEERPYIIAEVKTRHAPEFQDLLLQYGLATDAEFVVITDGYIDDCYRIIRDSYSARLEPVPDIPSYGRSLEYIGKQTNSELVNMDSTRLQKLIFHIVGLISINQDMSREQAFEETIKLLLLKAYDESKKEGLFRARFKEAPESIKSRIITLATQINEEHPGILKEPPNISDELSSIIVHKLQKYSLIGSGNDIVGPKLPIDEFLATHSRIFLMSRSVTKFMLDLLDPRKGSTLIDLVCGAGGTLIEAARAGCDIIGVENNPRIAQYAKVNLMLSGYPPNVFVQDVLSLCKELDSSLVDRFPSEGFDYVIVVPPFGSKIFDQRLSNFTLGRGRRSQSAEALFLERALSFLKPRGKMAIFLPEGFLISASTYDVRQFILKNFIVHAIIAFPARIFSPYSSVKASLLVLERSLDRGTTRDDKVFVAIINDEKDFSLVIKSFKDVQQGKAIPSEGCVFVTQLESAKQMDVNYLRGLLSVRNLTEKYKYVELQEICEIIAGVTLNRVGGKNSKSDSFYIRAGNVGDLLINFTEADKIKTKATASPWIAQSGDILMTRAGTVGRVALVSDDSSRLIVGSNVLRLRIRDKSRILPEFLLAYLRSKHGQAQIEMYTGGSAIMSINISGLKHMKVPVLPADQQRRIVSKVREIIAIRQESNRVLEELKKRQEKLLRELDGLIEGS